MRALANWGLFIISIVVLSGLVKAQTALPRETYIDVARAMVVVKTEVIAPEETFEDETTFELVSTNGFVLSESGFIVTARNRFTSAKINLENAIFQISTFNGFDSPPTPLYQAEYVSDYEYLDLLLLRVMNDSVGNPIPSREIMLNYIFTWDLEPQPEIQGDVFMISYLQTGTLSSFTFNKTECIDLFGGDNDSPSHSRCLDGGYYEDQTPGSVVVNSSGNVVGFIHRKGNLFVQYLPFNAVCEEVVEICENLLTDRAPAPALLRHAIICLGEDVTLPVRANASESADRVDNVRVGDHVFTLDTPSITVEGIAWVRIQTANGRRGWIPAVFNRTTTLLRYISQRTELDPLAVEPGSRVVVCAAFPSDHSKLWNQPNGREIKRLLSGTFVDVTGQPVERENGLWWPVIDMEGTTGWLVDTSDGTRNLIALPN